MKDEHVKFETAKLLKEKGFDWEVFHFYNENGEFRDREGDCYSLYNWNYPTKDEYGSQYCSAPTQQMACRWLREERRIHICPIPANGYYYWASIYIENGDRTLNKVLSRNGRKAYEDAIEAALEYCLTNLI